MRAYHATGEVSYLKRAATVFDFVLQAWTPQFCGGGVNWCPVSGSDAPYKNAITNELFLSSAMALHPFAEQLGKHTDYYLNWAQTEWAWLTASGMLNSRGLFVDLIHIVPVQPPPPPPHTHTHPALFLLFYVLHFYFLVVNQ